MRYVVLLVSFFLCIPGLHTYAQDTVHTQIAQQLPGITVSAYGLKRQTGVTPASVNRIDTRSLQRFTNTGILPAVNATPGVRMEERSPGSYRFSIRGSSLRSPFGVRNVKVYYNGIPITDPGGFTYLNQLGFYNIADLTIIKGPGSSLYGAGNGGVLLANSFADDFQKEITAGYTMGSYGLNNVVTSFQSGDSNLKNKVTYQYLGYDGYRRQSASKKHTISWDLAARLGKRTELSTHLLFNDLYYQTPGALTLAEYTADPRMARPAVGTTPGAIDNKAAIYQKNLLGGLTFRHQFSSRWNNTTTLYGAYTNLTNPNIRNYSQNKEPHFGGRTVAAYRQGYLYIQTGAEVQQGYTSAKVYTNNEGEMGSLTSSDRITSTNALLFTQATWRIKNWILEPGISLSNYRVHIKRTSVTPPISMNKSFALQPSPRLGILYRTSQALSTYINIARGFSPPTTAELSPTGSNINLSLDAEYSWNYEAGIRGILFRDRFSYDISAFYYSLSNTIVQRRDAAGGDLYTNSGATSQPGLEARLDYTQPGGSFFHPHRFFISYTAHRFTYTDFVQVTDDYSGKNMPGVPANSIAAGADFSTRIGLALSVTYNYNSTIPLNDANTSYAPEYHLLFAKLAYTLSIKRNSIELFTGADNILDQRYSLGNDINAFGGRYYNAAPGINYFAGILLRRK